MISQKQEQAPVEADSRPYHTSIMELFVKIFNGIKL